MRQVSVRHYYPPISAVQRVLLPYANVVAGHHYPPTSAVLQRGAAAGAFLGLPRNGGWPAQCGANSHTAAVLDGPVSGGEPAQDRGLPDQCGHTS